MTVNDDNLTTEQKIANLQSKHDRQPTMILMTWWSDGGWSANMTWGVLPDERNFWSSVQPTAEAALQDLLKQVEGHSNAISSW